MSQRVRRIDNMAPVTRDEGGVSGQGGGRSPRPGTDPAAGALPVGPAKSVIALELDKAAGRA